MHNTPWMETIKRCPQICTTIIYVHKAACCTKTAGASRNRWHIVFLLLIRLSRSDTFIHHIRLHESCSGVCLKFEPQWKAFVSKVKGQCTFSACSVSPSCIIASGRRLISSILWCQLRWNVPQSMWAQSTRGVWATHKGKLPSANIIFKAEQYVKSPFYLRWKIVISSHEWDKERVEQRLLEMQTDSSSQSYHCEAMLSQRNSEPVK